MKTVKTPKGTELPLIQLKGKDYLQVAHRLQWFNEVENNFIIETIIIRAEKEESIVTAKVSVIKDDKLFKSSTATKREDTKGFADHLEKAETGAIGRALAMLGYGTQFAVADLDEGSRIVDAPVTNVKTSFRTTETTNDTLTKATAVSNGSSSTTNGSFGSFRKTT